MRGPVTITLPETLDATSLARLRSSLDEAASSEASAWIVRGAGNGTFCKGMAFAELARGADARDGLALFARVLGALRSAPRPTIAVVDGGAIGGGVGFAAACDRVIATPDATFALPEALFGILPGVVMPIVLERVSFQRARLLALDGEARDASWAEGAGLVDEVVSSDRMEAHLRRAVRALSRVSDARVLGLRAWCDQARVLPIGEALARGAAVTAALLDDRHVRAGLTRFANEGIPPWSEVS